MAFCSDSIYESNTYLYIDFNVYLCGRYVIYANDLAFVN